MSCMQPYTLQCNRSSCFRSTQYHISVGKVTFCSEYACHGSATDCQAWVSVAEWDTSHESAIDPNETPKFSLAGIWVQRYAMLGQLGQLPTSRGGKARVSVPGDETEDVP